MATSRSVPKKSAEDVLLESFGELTDAAAEKMSDKEFLTRFSLAPLHVRNGVVKLLNSFPQLFLRQPTQ